MRILLLYLFVCVCVSNEIEFDYKIKNNNFKCNTHTANNIRWAIANELNISYYDVEVTCENLNSKKLK